MKINRIEHMCEGNGHVIIKELLDEQQLNGKCGLYAEVTLEPDVLLVFICIMGRVRPIIF